MTPVYENHSLLHLGDIQALTCSLLWAGHGGYCEGCDKPSSQQDEWAVVGGFSCLRWSFRGALPFGSGQYGILNQARCRVWPSRGRGLSLHYQLGVNESYVSEGCRVK